MRFALISIVVFCSYSQGSPSFSIPVSINREYFDEDDLARYPEYRVTLSADRIPINVADDTLVGMFSVSNLQENSQGYELPDAEIIEAYIPDSIGLRTGNRLNRLFYIKRFPSGHYGLVVDRKPSYSWERTHIGDTLMVTVGVIIGEDVRFARHFELLVSEPIYMRMDPKPVSLPENLTVGTTVAQFMMDPPESVPILTGFHHAEPYPQGSEETWDYTLFIRNKGELWGIGNNSYGQLGQRNAGNEQANQVQEVSKILNGGVTRVWTGRSYHLFTKADGSLWLMGAFFYERQYLEVFPEGYEGKVFETPVQLTDLPVKEIYIDTDHRFGIYIETLSNSLLWQSSVLDEDDSIPPPRVVLDQKVKKIKIVQDEEWEALVLDVDGRWHWLEPTYDEGTKTLDVLFHPLEDYNEWLDNRPEARKHFRYFNRKRMYEVKSDGSLGVYKNANYRFIDVKNYDLKSEPVQIPPESNRPEDTHNSYFLVDGDRLVLNKPLDYETNHMCKLYFKLQHPERGSLERVVHFRIKDLPEAPVEMTLTEAPVVHDAKYNGKTYGFPPFSCPESLAGGSQIGILSATDSDFPEEHDFELVDFRDGETNDNHLFEIGETPEGKPVLKTRPGTFFDYESRQDYTLGLRVTDKDGLKLEKSIPFKIRDVNEAPLAIRLSRNTFHSDVVPGANLALLTALDDAGDIHSFELVDPPEGKPSDNRFCSVRKNADGSSVLQLAQDLPSMPFGEKQLRLFIQAKDRWRHVFRQEVVMHRVEPVPSISLVPGKFTRETPVGAVVGKLVREVPGVEVILTGVSLLRAGEGKTLYIQEDGSLWAMGYLTPYYVIRLSDGTIHNRGRYYSGEGDPNPVRLVNSGVVDAKVRGSEMHYLNEDGTHWYFKNVHEAGGRGIVEPVQVNDPWGWVHDRRSAAGFFILEDGSLWFSGNPEDVRFLDTIWSDSPGSWKIVDSGVLSVAVGMGAVAFVKEGGSLWTLGYPYLPDEYVWITLPDGRKRRVLDLSKQNLGVPHLMVGSGVLDVVGGKEHFAILMDDGTVWGFGSNRYGLLGVDSYNSKKPTQAKTQLRIQPPSGTHNAFFKLDGDEIRLNRPVAFESRETYNLHFLATLPDGKEVEKQFSLQLE